MKHLHRSVSLLLLLGLAAGASVAGTVSPDCGVDKTAKHVAEKSTTGVSTNRCSPSKAVSSSDKNVPHPDHNNKGDGRSLNNGTTAERARDAGQH